MLGRELEGRANKLVRESKERAEKAKRQAEKERILRQRQEDRQKLFEEQKRQQRLAEEAAVEAVSPAWRGKPRPSVSQPSEVASQPWL